MSIVVGSVGIEVNNSNFILYILKKLVISKLINSTIFYHKVEV